MPEPTHAFITSRYCPDCGYELTGLTLAARVTCPECGVISDMWGLLIEPPPGPLGQAWRVLCWCWNARMRILLPIVLMVGLLGVLSAGRSPCNFAVRAAVQLGQIHRSCVIYAAESGGRYPAHAAALIPENYFSPALLMDRYVQGCSYIGTYDVLRYDWSREALTAAIQSTDLKAPYYRLGDFWWVRLPAPTNNPSIVAGWSQSQGTRRGTRWVIFDDGHYEQVKISRWRKLWRADAEARRKIGLPAVAPPPP